MSKTRAPLRVVAIGFGVFALSLLSCGREVTAPSGGVSAFRHGMFQVEPRFPALANGVSAESSVAFERVHIVLRREDGSIAIDTVVFFPPGVDEVSLSLNVPLPANAPAAGVPLSVSMGYVNAAGDTVFKGGPFNVTVAPAAPGATAPPPVQIPLQYTGVGSTAVGVHILPKTTSGQNGDQLSFAAVAVDEKGIPIAGTPIVYSTSTPTLITVPNTTAPNAVLRSVRGTGTFIAQLLTGPADTARIDISLKATNLALTDGGNQTVGAGLDVPQTIRVRVTAPDGVGVGSIPVTVAVASGGGVVTPPSATTSADGYVNIGWTLGPIVGGQSLLVTSPGLAGSPLTINATASALPPSALAIVTQPASVTVNTRLASVQVSARDAAGLPSASFVGSVSVALGANPGGATLGGTRTRVAAGGNVVFDDLTIDKPGVGYTLVFTATGLSPATSIPFEVRAGAATRLAFTAVPATGTAGIALSPAITVSVLDAAGNVATAFSGSVAMALSSGTAGATLGGTLTRPVVNGVATFTDVNISKSGAGYTLAASLSGLTGATSSAISIAAGAAIRLQVIAGADLTRRGGTDIDSVVALVTDAQGNGVAGRTVGFAVASGAGHVSAATVNTDVLGRAAVRWSLGLISGPQTMTVTSAGLTGSPILVTATATAGTPTQLKFQQAPAVRWVAGQSTDSIVVNVVDVDNNLVSTFSGPVTANIVSGPTGSAIFGLTTVTALQGVAIFRGLALQQAGTYELAFRSGALTAAPSVLINVSAGTQISTVVDSGATQSGSAGATLPSDFVVRVTDNYGNIAVGVTVTWAVTAGGGTLSATSSVTDDNGRARTRLTLGAGAGANTVAVTAPSATVVNISATASLVGIGTPTKITLGYDNLNVTTGVNTPINVFLDAAPPSPVTVTLSTLDTLSRWATSTVTIPAGSNFAVATAVGRYQGSSHAVASAPGLGADTVLLYVYQANVGLQNSYLYINANSDTVETRVNLSAPAPAGGTIVSFELSDSGYVHIVPSPGLRATGNTGGCDFDPPAAAAKVRLKKIANLATLTIKEGETQGYIFFISDSLAGSVNFTVSAPGYGSSTGWIQVYARDLNLGSSVTTSLGQKETVWLGRGAYAQLPLTVNLVSLNPAIATVPATALITQGNSSGNFSVVGTGVGSTSVIASAPGWTPDTMLVDIHPSTIRVSCCTAISMKLGSATPGSVYVYADDSITTGYSGYRATPLVVSASSSNPAVVVPAQATVIIPTDNYYAQAYFNALGAGSAYLRYTDPGHGIDSVLVIVDGTLQTVNWTGTTTVGAGQYLQPYFYLSGSSTPQKSATSLALASVNSAVAAVDGTAIVGANQYSSDTFRVYGQTPGTANIDWSGAGYSSGTAPVTVTTPQLTYAGPYYTLYKGGSTQYFAAYVRDSLYNTHYRTSDLTVTITSADTTKVKPTSATMTIYQGQYYNYGYLNPIDTGSTTIMLSAPGHTPVSFGVTVYLPSGGAPPDTTPRINIANSLITIGNRQYTTFSAYRSGNQPATRLSIRKLGAATVLSDTAWNLAVNEYYSPTIYVSGVNRGTDTLIFTAPGHVSDTLLVRVTTPQITAYVSGESSTLLQNYPYGEVYFYLTDSLGNSHNSTDTVRVTVTSSSPGVASALSPSLILYPDEYYTSSPMQLTGPGSAKFILTDDAGRYRPDTSNAVTVLQPQLHFPYYSNPLRLGMRQRTDSEEQYVYTDYSVLVPTWVRLNRSTTALVSMPDSVLIPAGGNYAYYETTALDTVGGLEVTAAAPGYASVTGGITVSRPTFYANYDNMYTGDGGRQFEVVAVESDGYNSRLITEDVRVMLSSSAPGIVGIDSAAVTIPAGSSSNWSASTLPISIGRATITASDARTGFRAYAPGFTNIQVSQSQLYPNNDVLRLGIGQRTNFYTSVSFYPQVPLPYSIIGVGGHTSMTGTLADTIPAGYYYRYFQITGVSAGSDTLTLSAPSILSGRLIIDVSEGVFGISSVPTSMKVGSTASLYVYLQTPDRNYGYSAGNTTIGVVGSNVDVLDNSGAGTGSPISSVVVADGGSYAPVTLVAGATPGTATFTISGTGYQQRIFTIQIVP